MKKWLLAEVITDIPRWFFLLAWLTFYGASGTAIGYEFYLYPERPVLVNIKQGLDFAGGGLYPWLLAGLYLHLEVLHMILSRRANRLAEERADAAERAAAEAVKQAAEQAAKGAAEQAMKQTVEQAAEAANRAAAAAEQAAATASQAAAQAVEVERAKVQEWYEQHKDHWPENLPLPPGIARNGADNSKGNQ